MILLLTAACGVRVRDLPFREYPVVTEFACLADIEERGDELIKKGFSGTPFFPLFLCFKLNEVEGAGSLRLLLYDDAGKLVRQKVFNYGQPGTFYEHITVYQRYDDLPDGTYTVVIFWGQELVFRRRLQVGQIKQIGQIRRDRLIGRIHISQVCRRALGKSFRHLI